MAPWRNRNWLARARRGTASGDADAARALAVPSPVTGPLVPSRDHVTEPPREPRPPADDPLQGMLPADLGPTHNVTEQPSQGSLQAWSTKFSPLGRTCVAGGTSVSSATVTFAAEGAVTRVVVGGWAAQNGRSECIRAATMGLRIDPFLRPSFSFTFPVRP